MFWQSVAWFNLFCVQANLGTAIHPTDADIHMWRNETVSRSTFFCSSRTAHLVTLMHAYYGPLAPRCLLSCLQSLCKNHIKAQAYQASSSVVACMRPQINATCRMRERSFTQF